MNVLCITIGPLKAELQKKTATIGAQKNTVSLGHRSGSHRRNRDYKSTRTKDELFEIQIFYLLFYQPYQTTLVFQQNWCLVLGARDIVVLNYWDWFLTYIQTQPQIFLTFLFTRFVIVKSLRGYFKKTQIRLYVAIRSRLYYEIRIR